MSVAPLRGGAAREAELLDAEHGRRTCLDAIFIEIDVVQVFARSNMNGVDLGDRPLARTCT
jgi:hypothetical protein